MLVGGYREGGPGYYALDITQPDVLNSENVPQPAGTYIPSCFDGDSNSDCGNRPYPSVLWEFQDEQSVQVSAGIFVKMQLDEDLNNERDLGNSWSKATSGRIRVCTGSCSPDETEDRFVAIFGGGVGPDPFFPRGSSHLVLSGGLTPANVTDGILQVRPRCPTLAVDVSSGVEAAKGIKDARKIHEFVAAVRAADAQLAGQHDRIPPT